MSKPVNVISLGAGVQSSAMLMAYSVGLLEPLPDLAVFADTQVEPASVYTWLERLKTFVAGRIPIIVASKGNIVDDYLNMSRRFAAIPFFTINDDGTKGMMRRQCTKEYKIEVIQRAIRDHLGYKPKQRVRHAVNSLIGISIDEAVRMKPSRTHWIQNVYPLIEVLAWDRERCRQYAESFGLGSPPKSACYICPFRNNLSWKSLRQRDPEAFANAITFERRLQSMKAERHFRGMPYLHSSRIPLDQVDFDALAPESPLFGEFGQECEGMCGI